ncbi:hypothetical protein JCM21714_2074 [Gracilibacillus boraciitolerans JCM 21714]|uniref:Uncharacterized protein n=1 Tax=Gracilibacillus boraciitolerans JCM 21714 TaxID=1298598 RepID=W4VIK3_9BACI|nr:ParM/StbA family protein [Gracilibacillus boraciitolerans]GAE93042.1 hypothetical protein JCM21714_2074 [Gracilibacillus boraciitolerans JCM 21714]
MKKLEYVAVDVGYGFVKVISSNGKKVLFPSVVGSGRERMLANFLDEKEQEETDLSEIHIKLNGKHYFIGEMALKNSTDGSRVFERERYNHEYSQILMHAAIQLVVEKGTEEVVLFTGLPLSYMESQKDKFKQKLLQETINIEWITGKTKGQKQIVIKEAYIFPQGFSALWATLLNHEGKTTNKDLFAEGNQIAVIDIGFRTTDLCVIEMQDNASFKALAPFSDTLDQGVVNLYENIKVAYRNQTGGQDLSENKIKRILSQKNISYKGKKIDLTEEVREAHESVANAINDRINKLWKDESDTFDHIYVVGGGGSLFMDYLQSNFDNRLESIVASQFANAIGYYRIGKIMIGDIPSTKVATG